MSPDPGQLAIAFANTLSSTARDRIATLGEFRSWAGTWPVFAPHLADLPASAVASLRVQRDATQQVMHYLVEHKPPSPAAFERATRPGLLAAPFRLAPTAGGGLTGAGDPLDCVAHLLGRAVVDLLLSPQAAALRRCAGAPCRQVFLSHRAERRWCDGRICGNRARVAAHVHRHGIGPGT